MITKSLTVYKKTIVSILFSYLFIVMFKKWARSYLEHKTMIIISLHVKNVD